MSLITTQPTTGKAGGWGERIHIMRCGGRGICTAVMQISRLLGWVVIVVVIVGVVDVVMLRAEVAVVVAVLSIWNRMPAMSGMCEVDRLGKAQTKTTTKERERERERITFAVKDNAKVFFVGCARIPI